MNKTKINRADVFEWYRLENPRLDPQLLREVFAEATDKDLAELYGLKILGPGSFYR